jgi:hypothetical protein
MTAYNQRIPTMDNIIPNTNTDHQFDIGDTVKHAEIDNLQGVVVYQLMWGDTFIPNYGVQWDLYTTVSHESEDNLLKF